MKKKPNETKKKRLINIFLFFSFSFIPLANNSNRSNKTFKPKKNIPEGTHQYDLMKHAAATLGSGNLRNAVQLPEGEDVNEWIAVNSELTH
jgi:Mob1/phocein family